MSNTIDTKGVFKAWKKNPEYVQEHESLEQEFAVADALIKARKAANLTQAEIAKKMNTTQSAIARIEGGANPSFKTLQRYATATGTRINIELVPVL